MDAYPDGSLGEATELPGIFFTLLARFLSCCVKRTYKVSHKSLNYFQNGCGIQMSQATPKKVSMVFKHTYAKISENLVAIASTIPLSMAS